MQNLTTVAIIGANEKGIFSLANKIAQTNRVLLFDKDEAALSIVCKKIISALDKADIEIMVCPTNASWEADIIILPKNFLLNNSAPETIRMVATGKIVILFSAEQDFENFDIACQKWFPYSKVITISKLENDFSIQGYDIEVIDKVIALFTAINFKKNSKFINNN